MALVAPQATAVAPPQSAQASKQTVRPLRVRRAAPAAAGAAAAGGKEYEERSIAFGRGIAALVKGLKYLNESGASAFVTILGDKGSYRTADGAMMSEQAFHELLTLE